MLHIKLYIEIICVLCTYICTNSYTDVLLHAHTYIHILMIDYFDYSLEF